jgi:hypothetical protein
MDDSPLTAPILSVLPVIDFATRDKDHCVPHPVSGELSYAYVAAYKSRNLSVKVVKFFYVSAST